MWKVAKFVETLPRWKALMINPQYNTQNTAHERFLENMYAHGTHMLVKSWSCLKVRSTHTYTHIYNPYSVCVCVVAGFWLNESTNKIST